MDYEEALRIAGQEVAFSRYCAEGRHNFAICAFEGIKKQIPVEIKEIHVDEYFCPACGSENNADEGKVWHKYCPQCGQRIIQKIKDDKNDT